MLVRRRYRRNTADKMRSIFAQLIVVVYFHPSSAILQIIDNKDKGQFHLPAAIALLVIDFRKNN